MQTRTATLDDAEPIRGIYNFYVAGSVATFDLEQRSLEEQLAWMRDRSGAFEVLVIIDQDEVAGFASLSPYKQRAAYRTTVESSVYLHPNAVGKGLGRGLLAAVIDVARTHGFHSVIARINATMEPSLGLHEAMGYERVGVEREIGRKFGKWHDVQIMQLML
ncbi:MAG: N-acetyltransferase family protein [Acidimicrobiales bacterium]